MSQTPSRKGADIDHHLLRASWRRAWTALGLEPSAAAFVDLLARYQEPHRHYHTLQHLQECIALLEPMLSQAGHPGELELALWFHDAICNTHAKDNESRSAALASSVLTEQAASPEIVCRVRELILATAYQSSPHGIDAKMLVDVDLGILAAPPERFAEYEAQIRAEYRWMPEAAYRAGRQEVLQGFLRRSSVFNLTNLSTEQQARRNLERALAALAQPSNAPAQEPAPNQEGGVGSRLWWVGDTHRLTSGEVTITTLEGNRAMLSNGVLLDLDTMNAVPDPVSCGRCYASREEYEARALLLDEWADFCRDVSSVSLPDGIDVEGIRALRAQLGIKDFRRPRSECHPYMDSQAQALPH